MTATPQLRLTLPIDAAPAVVWAVLTDIPAAARTLSGVESIEMITDGPYSVGTRWRETRTMLGMRETQEMEVAEVDPERSTVIVATSGDVVYRTEFRLLPTPRGTDLSMIFDAEMPQRSGARALLEGLLGRLGMRAAQRTMERDLQDVAVAAMASR